MQLLRAAARTSRHSLLLLLAPQKFKLLLLLLLLLVVVVVEMGEAVGLSHHLYLARLHHLALLLLHDGNRQRLLCWRLHLEPLGLALLLLNA